MPHLDNSANIVAVQLKEQVSDPATPASGYDKLYAKSSVLYYIDSSGTVHALATGGVLPAPGSSGNALFSNGSIWTSRAIADGDLPGTLTGHTLVNSIMNGTVSGTSVSTDGTFASPSDTVLASQKATKTYVDAVAAGLSPKQSVQAATTTALPSNVYNNGSSGVGATLTGVATGVLTIDGHTVALNDRILVQNEAAQANNGIYLCTVAGAIGVAYVLTRTTDNNTSAEILGSYCFVETGTVNANSGFVNTNTSAITIGTTAITFTQFSGAGEITAGTGLSKSGNTLSIDSTVVTLTGTQTLTNKNLTQPTIGDFTNATHNHQNAVGGGTLDAAALASGTLNNARVNWAAPGTLGSTTPNTGNLSTLQVASSPYTPVGQFDLKTVDTLGTTTAVYLQDSSGNPILLIRDDGRVGWGISNPTLMNEEFEVKRTRTSATDNTYGIRSTFTVNISSTDNNQWAALLGECIIPSGNSTNYTNLIRGSYNYVHHDGSGTVSNAVSTYAVTQFNNASNTTNAYSFEDSSKLNNTANVGTFYHLYLNPVVNNGTGILTNEYGLYIGNLTSASTTTYAIYVSGNNKSFFGGQVNFNGLLAMNGSNQIQAADGTNSAPGLSFGSNTNMGMYRPANNTLGFTVGGSERLRVDGTGTVIQPGSSAGGIAAVSNFDANKIDAVHNAVSRAATFIHSNTAANAANNNIGVDVAWAAALDNAAAGAATQISRIRSFLPNNAHASYTSRAVWSASDNGAERDVIGIGGNGSAGLLGFYSIATSPIMQPTTSGSASTFAANTSGIANDTATWDSYTIGQVVKALRNLGILA